MSIYDAYAPFYDGSGQIRFALLMGQYLREILARHPVDGRRALDVACGTGTLALLLSDDGWEAVGLDRSAPMLAIARARAAAAEAARLTFVQGDMRSLDDGQTTPPIPRASFDLATCIYDSLNYLLDEAELASCFAGVARLLRPNGLFVADMNTRYFLEHDWGEYEALERPGFVQITQSRFEPVSARSTMLLTGFVGDDQQGYRRFDELHIERAYPDALVAELLERAGLHVEAAYDCFTFQPAYDHSQRIAWVARKQ